MAYVSRLQRTKKMKEGSLICDSRSHIRSTIRLMIKGFVAEYRAIREESKFIGLVTYE
jgi:hypothetical protein